MDESRVDFIVRTVMNGAGISACVIFATIVVAAVIGMMYWFFGSLENILVTISVPIILFLLGLVYQGVWLIAVKLRR